METLEGYTPGVIGDITALHGRYYAQNWDLGVVFESKVAAGLAEFYQRYDAKRDHQWNLYDGSSLAGSITIDGIAASTKGAQVRWFILDPAFQSRGLGSELMAQAMSFCEENGYDHIYLTTFAGLNAARHLYEKWGFRLTQEKQASTWGVELTEQVFEKGGS